MIKSEHAIEIYTDGSSLGNPGPGGWGAVIIQGSMNNEQLTMNNDVVELGGHEAHTTNNRMELMAAISALQFLSSYGLRTTGYKLVLNSDSAYVLNGITKWVYGWEKNGWQTSTKSEVLNRDLWQELLVLARNPIFKNLEWKKVKGHSGVDLNERCDVIATSFAGKENIDLFVGSIEEYKHLIHNHSPKSTPKKKSSKKSTYISFVDGLAMEHTTWVECEKRVKGAKGARYKKVANREEAEEIIRNWKAK